MLQMLTYLAMKHDTRVMRVDTVRAYSFGALYFVEVSKQVNIRIRSTSWVCVLPSRHISFGIRYSFDNTG
jgi:hypothetical protein